MERRKSGPNAGLLWAVSLLLVVMVPGVVLAQEPAHSFSELESRVHVGDRLRVVDSGGKKTQGTVESISESSLRIRVDSAVREFREPAIREVQREFSDPIRNGTLKGAVIGTGVGVAAGVLATGEACESPSCSMGVVALFAGIGAGAGAASGALGDSLRHSYATIFAQPGVAARRLNVLPLLSRDKKGVKVTVRF